MLNGNEKRVLIVKDPQSKFFDEVVFILKDGFCFDTGVTPPGRANLSVKYDQRYLIRQAELIIESHIRQTYKPGKQADPAGKKKNTVKVSRTDLSINTALVLSITLFAMLILKIYGS